jgi:hypothetical protein
VKTVCSLLTLTLTASLMAACAGTPTSLGTRASTPLPDGPERVITAEACGFQLLLFIPININDRMQRANRALEAQADGGFITDVKVQESWAYGLVGTVYCTTLQAKVTRTKSS